MAPSLASIFGALAPMAIVGIVLLAYPSIRRSAYCAMLDRIQPEPSRYAPAPSRSQNDRCGVHGRSAVAPGENSIADTPSRPTLEKHLATRIIVRRTGQHGISATVRKFVSHPQGVRTGRGEMGAHAGGLLHHPGTDLVQPQVVGRELGPGDGILRDTALRRAGQSRRMLHHDGWRTDYDGAG